MPIPENRISVEHDVEKLAGRLYTVYCRAVGGKAHNGEPLPDWKEFSVDLKKLLQSNAWRAVAREAIAAETGVASAPCEPIAKVKPFKRPEGLFWLHTDNGDGERWHLCQIKMSPQGNVMKPMLQYVTEDFEDYWYDEDWCPEDIREIEPPKD